MLHFLEGLFKNTYYPEVRKAMARKQRAGLPSEFSRDGHTCPCSDLRRLRGAGLAGQVPPLRPAALQVGGWGARPPATSCPRPCDSPMRPTRDIGPSHPPRTPAVNRREGPSAGPVAAAAQGVAQAAEPAGGGRRAAGGVRGRAGRGAHGGRADAQPRPPRPPLRSAPPAARAAANRTRSSPAAARRSPPCPRP